MTFNIVFVENDKKSKVPAAVATKKWGSDTMLLTQVFSPEELEAALNPDVDLVLADIGFPDGEEGPDINRISDILDIVESTSARWPGSPDAGGHTLPVIVYTSRTFELSMLLQNMRRRLYDIWDKSVATPEYVAWRLGTVARERERARPGRVLQKIIGQLRSGPTWSAHVESMLRKYVFGWGELDQIQQCGGMIGAISDDLACPDGAKMWDAIERWELIDRAADRRVRGHARHALHVYWLGYILLNDPAMAAVWGSTWATLLEKRAERDKVKTVSYIEALNAIWFFAAIFHDVGYVAQDGPKVVNEVQSVGRAFDFNWAMSDGRNKSKYLQRADHAFEQLRVAGGSYQKLADAMETFWAGTQKSTPDHGCASAGRLLEAAAEAKNEQTSWWLQEAARAAALHSAFPAVDVPGLVKFDADPIACLLLLLDQLQTWDRERPPSLKDRDWPELAELVSLQIDSGRRPHVRMTIRYIVRRHVEQSKVVFDGVEQQLTAVLRRLPVATMRELKPKLPFDVSVKFYLGDEEMKDVAVLT
jgi:hypothetical protein